MAHFHDNALIGASGQGGYQIERSLRFHSGDSAYLNRTYSGACQDAKLMTISVWVKRGRLTTSGQQPIFSSYSAVRFGGDLTWTTADKIQFRPGGNGDGASNQYSISTDAVFRDPSAWYHIVIQYDSTQATSTNRQKIYVNSVQQTVTGNYPTQNYLHTYAFNNANNQIGAYTSYGSDYLDSYLTEFHFIDGQALTPSSFGETDTITGVWKPKKYSGTYGTNGFYLKFADNSIGVDLTSTATLTAPFGGTAENARVADSVYLISNTTTGSGFTLVQEDFGAVKQLSRYYIAAMYFTGGSSTFELQYSTNGSSWTAAASLSITASGQNFSGNINVNARYVRLQATAFGVNGQGGIDSLIIYQDPLGVDSSPNSNNWNVNNFSVTAGAGNDSMIDTPTPYADGGNGRGNYCTLNPLDSGTQSGVVDGNLVYYYANISAWITAGGTIAVNQGKWYWEATASNIGASSDAIVGIGAASDYYVGANYYAGQGATNYGYFSLTGNKLNNNTGTTYGATYTNNDVIGVALDMDAGTVTFYKNNVSQGVAFSGLTGLYKPIVSSKSGILALNFGQRAFAYTPPSGFLALNTQNLPEPSIKKPNQWMDINLATGNNSTQTITNAGGFQPDLVWMKIRSASENHILYDSARGTDNFLVPNLTNAAASGGGQGLTSFNSNGFTLGSINPNYAGSPTFVAWQWKESATPGFDIVTYTGTGSATTVAHNLGVAPSMIIAKGRTNVDNWPVGHASRGWDRHILLNSTAAEAVTSTTWNNTAPTSSVFTVGTDTRINQNGINYVAYCFSEVAGFSKFGSYTGNGSADGPFVFCGFRPRYVLMKRTDSAADWVVIDAIRNSYNAAGKWLLPNDPAAEYNFDALYPIDILSNGFKIRTSVGSLNGGTIIYAAFAESPFKYSLAR